MKEFDLVMAEMEVLLDDKTINDKGKEIINSISDYGKTHGCITEKQDELIHGIVHRGFYRYKYAGARHGFVYVFKDTRNNEYKIGFSKIPIKRLKTLKTSRPSIKMIFMYEGTTNLEKYLHKKFERFCVGGEWFSNLISYQDNYEIDYIANTKTDENEIIETYKDDLLRKLCEEFMNTQPLRTTNENND